MRRGEDRRSGARKHGVLEATLYNWRARYGGMDVSEAKRQKQLVGRNAKLKKLLAEQMLDAPRTPRTPRKKWWARLPGAKLSRICGS